jgi:tRNA threonylcarbamoyladenosine biosynthesis protein TsaB
LRGVNRGVELAYKIREDCGRTRLIERVMAEDFTLAANDSPLLLVIETSGRAGVVALAEGETLLSVQYLDEARRHARDLAPVAAGLLGERGRTPRELAAAIVSVGPGSYTGLRVGVVSAKVLAYATGCRLVGVRTFAAIARQAPDSVSRLDVLADAQQDKVYVQSFGRTSGEWEAVTDLAIVPFASWQASRSTDAFVTGPGLHRWATHVANGERMIEKTMWDPRPESLLALGLARYRAGEGDDPYALEPLYLRPSSAEQQWRDRKR